MSNNLKHPAKYTDCFLSTFAELLKGCDNVLDPFAGTGKIGAIREYGFEGKIYANELEPEWLINNDYNCDVLSFEDAEFIDYPSNFFDAICTSPTYGNRMADHFVAKDHSKRITYTHCLGRQLKDGNTGKMQWGEQYRIKHEKIYAHLADICKDNAVFVLNIKNHIRNGEEIDVKQFHIDALQKVGFELVDSIFVTTNGSRFGANANKRTKGEYILLFRLKHRGIKVERLINKEDTQ